MYAYSSLHRAGKFVQHFFLFLKGISFSFLFLFFFLWPVRAATLMSMYKIVWEKKVIMEDIKKLKKCRGRNWRWKMLELEERRGKDIFLSRRRRFWFNQLRPAVRSQNTCVIFYVREDVQCSNKGIFFYIINFHRQSTS